MFAVSGGTNYESFYALYKACWHLHGFNVCTGLPKKTLDTSLRCDRNIKFQEYENFDWHEQYYFVFYSFA